MSGSRSIDARLANGIAAFACAAGVDRAFVRRAAPGKTLILCYHGVADGPLPEGCPSWHHVDVHDFERQIRWIANHFTVLPIDEALSLDVDKSDRVAVITFDDGYLNNRMVALPVLQAVGVPATFYLATGMVERGDLLWTVRLEAAFRLARGRRIDMSVIGLGDRSIVDASSRIAAAGAAIRCLKSVSKDAREHAIRELLGQLATPDPSVLEPFRMLQWRDVRAMERDGNATFGAHTVNHEIVSRLDDAMLRAEITDSIAAVTSRVSKTTATFAYPNGTSADFDGRSIPILREAGITAALTTIHGFNDRATDRFALKRLVVGRGLDFDRFRLAASGFTAFVGSILRSR